MKTYTLLITLSFLGHVTSQGMNDNQTEAEEFLTFFNSASGMQLNTLSQKQWNLDTNITDYNEEPLNVLQYWPNKRADGFRVDAIEKPYEVQDIPLYGPLSGLSDPNDVIPQA